MRLGPSAAPRAQRTFATTTSPRCVHRFPVGSKAGRSSEPRLGPHPPVRSTGSQLNAAPASRAPASADKPVWKRPWVWVVGIILLVIIAAGFAPSDTESVSIGDTTTETGDGGSANAGGAGGSGGSANRGGDGGGGSANAGIGDPKGKAKLRVSNIEWQAVDESHVQVAFTVENRGDTLADRSA